MLLQCPNLKNVHALGCQDMLIGAIRSQKLINRRNLMKQCVSTGVYQGVGSEAEGVSGWNIKPWSDLPMVIPPLAEGLFLASTLFILGNDRTLKFWHDRWLDGECIMDLASALMPSVKPAAKLCTVADALNQNSSAHDIRRAPSITAITEYLDVWERVRNIFLRDEPLPLDCKMVRSRS